MAQTSATLTQKKRKATMGRMNNGAYKTFSILGVLVGSVMIGVGQSQGFLVSIGAFLAVASGVWFGALLGIEREKGNNDK